MFVVVVVFVVTGLVVLVVVVVVVEVVQEASNTDVTMRQVSAVQKAALFIYPPFLLMHLYRYYQLANYPVGFYFARSVKYCQCQYPYELIKKQKRLSDLTGVFVFTAIE